MCLSVMFIYIDSFLSMGESIASVFLIATLLGVLFVPIYQKIAGLNGTKNNVIFEFNFLCFRILPNCEL